MSQSPHISILYGDGHLCILCVLLAREVMP
jgi:hypothetical protein